MTPSTALAYDVVDGLIASGVRHAVLAPGSRSAPLAYALHAADRAGRLTLHVRVDERAAGFLALGLAKLTRVPVAVLTTSGTAVANLHPAVLEAHHGLVPLLVLSADRPPELRGIGANQTTNQPGIFGAVLRWEAELGGESQERAPRLTVESAVMAARGARTSAGAVSSPAGPVHLNVAFREPLVPDLGEAPHEWPSPAAHDQTSDPQTPDASRAPRPLDLPERTLVVIGDLPEPGQAARVAAWSAQHGWPVVAEPFGGQPLAAAPDGPLPHGPLLLGTTWYAAHRPAHIVVAGRVTLSRSVLGALRADPERVTYLSAGPRWIGPSYEVARTVDLDAALDDSSRHGSALAARPSRWLRSWRVVAAALSDALPAVLPWGTGPAVARTLVAALPAGSTLMLGSSNSVRDVELAVDWSDAGGVQVVANRGLAGIDGVLSTAVGLALAGAAPAYALVGDLTFLHDGNALLIGPGEARPDLTIVVVNDDGGGIFATLEPGEPARAADFERIFGTGTGARLEDLARAFGVPYARARSAAELTAAVARPPHGPRVVEVTVERAGHRALRERLREVAELATSRALPDRDYPERGMRV